MEKQEENDRIYFEGFCEIAEKLALSKGSLCMNHSIIEKLNIKEKFNLIALKIKMINDQIIELDRLDYFFNRNNISKLYEIFKRDGNLANEQELNKLEQVLILSEEFMQLQEMYLETLMMEYLANKKKKQLACSRGKYHELQTLTFNSVLGKLDESIHIVKYPTTIGDLSRMFTCHEWTEMKIKIYLACKINEIKCVIDELFSTNKKLFYANVGKCGLFIGKKGVPITAHHLTTSSYKKLKTRSKIQNIISECNKKV